ncbi:protein of unknown function [Candidatus Hydrogenisulfobacillus filiaventi]|uniref:Uncharacterized protein n=1 Tax=Candidatus Hydrogenisulfobacillus filiaventi TaxID=2707344 RepID=A0A6F8ZEB7_9FIRM|nr:protein of unknown function [Candidatus Hydrogenisulfobacillus filiaventi]
MTAHSPQASRGRFVNLSYTHRYLAAVAGYAFSYVMYALEAGSAPGR